MRRKSLMLLASAALIVSTSACKTAADQKVASASDRSNGSWCQGDRLIRYSPADSVGQDDPGNTFDSDETVAEIQQHNARLRAACPEGDGG